LTLYIWFGFPYLGHTLLDLKESVERLTDAFTIAKSRVFLSVAVNKRPSLGPCRTKTNPTAPFVAQDHRISFRRQAGVPEDRGIALY
jgi:hypothetical protein